MEHQVKQLQHLMAIIKREGSGYVALCPELDIASQGDTVEEVRRNLTEALELFFETADASEFQRRLQELRSVKDRVLTEIERLRRAV